MSSWSNNDANPPAVTLSLSGSLLSDLDIDRIVARTLDAIAPLLDVLVKPVLPLDDAAELLKVSTKTLIRYERLSDFPIARSGDKSWVLTADLVDWLRANTAALAADDERAA